MSSELFAPGSRLVEGGTPRLAPIHPAHFRLGSQGLGDHLPTPAGGVSRRLLLKAACAIPALASSSPVIADEFVPQPGFWEVPRTIWARRPDSGEEIRATYWADGALLQDGYIQLCRFMRDLHMERRISERLRHGLPVPQGWFDTAFVDIALLDILYAFNGWLRHHGLDRALILTSIFRHTLTNMATEGAARDSWHIKAGAGDIVVPDVSNESVTRFGLWLSAGGVGYYAGKRFTHVDRGRVRLFRGA